MARITKAMIARNERIEQVIRKINEELGIEYGNALGHFAAKYGNNWAIELLDQWYSGRDASFEHYDNTGKRNQLGHLLRQIRNHPVYGPAFYDAYNG